MKISKRRQVLALGGLAAFAAGYSETAGRMVGKLLGHDAPKHKTAGDAPLLVERNREQPIREAPRVTARGRVVHTRADSRPYRGVLWPALARLAVSIPEE